MLIVQGDYPEANKYLSKKIKQEYFEFKFPYVGENEKFKEIDRFLWESRHEMTVFQNYYSGPCVIDISEWNDNPPNSYFEAFMYFLLDVSERCTLYFISDREISPRLIENLNIYFDNIETAALKLRRQSSARKTGVPLGFRCSDSNGKDDGNVRSKV